MHLGSAKKAFARENSMDNLYPRGNRLGMCVTSLLQNVRLVIAILVACPLICASMQSYAAVNTRELMQNQRVRDQAFRTLRATNTEYTFEYVVIEVPAGSIPGIDVPVPVSHNYGGKGGFQRW